MRKIIFLILLVNIYIITFAQSGSENMLKYWHYRNRLQYFVIPGTRQGESEILSERNAFGWPNYNTKWSNIGQHGVYFGYYLGMLATEYRLLMNNNQTEEAAKTLNELELALDQFDTYMDKCEYYWNEYVFTTDGFFVRENMPCDFLDTTIVGGNGYTINLERHLDLLNKNLTPDNVWDTATHTFHNLPAGHPGYTDNIDARMCNNDGKTKKEMMSQDEAIGVLQGLALVKKFCSPLATRSSNTACDIITYIRNADLSSGPIKWMIYDPDGNPDTTELDVNIAGIGGRSDANRYNWGFVEASKYFDSHCMVNQYNGMESVYVYASYLSAAFLATLGIPSPIFPSDELYWQFEGSIHDPFHTYNDDMKVILAAIGKSWHIGLKIRIGICPFCFRIPLYIQTTGKRINNLKSDSNNETFYLLLYELLNAKKTNYLSQNKSIQQINSAPCEGPYYYYYAGGDINGYHPANDYWGGWSSSYRWRNPLWGQEGSFHVENNGDTSRNFPANYNGLDFMVFYNLYQLKYGGIPYENYNDRYLSGNINTSQNLYAYNTITSTQVIDSITPSWVNYKAGEQIELKPGFHAQEGASFHAQIENINCGQNFITDSTFIPPNDTSTFEESSNVIVIPCDSMLNYQQSDTALVHFEGFEFDTTGFYNYFWNFSSDNVSPTPTTSTLPSPAVYFPCDHSYKITLVISRDSTDSTDAIADTMQFTLYKPCCNYSGIPIEKRLNNTTIPENKTINNNEQFNVFPNPTTGIFTVSCSTQNVTFTAYISNILTDVLFLKENITSSAQFDLSAKPKGIYFVKVVTTDGKIFTSKIVNK